MIIVKTTEMIIFQPEFWLKDKMLRGYFGVKTNSPAGLLTKVEDSIAKARVIATNLRELVLHFTTFQVERV